MVLQTNMYTNYLTNVSRLKRAEEDSLSPNFRKKTEGDLGNKAKYREFCQHALKGEETEESKNLRGKLKLGLHLSQSCGFILVRHSEAS